MPVLLGNLDVAAIRLGTRSVTGVRLGEDLVWAPAVDGLIVDLAAEAGNGTTTLTWTEAGEFDSVNIYRDGVLYDNVAAGVGTWTSGTMDDGLYEWVLVPVTGGVEGDPTAPIEFGCMTADYWVDAVNGNDGNSGTSPAQAKKTLRAAGSLVTAAGKKIAVRGGVYSEYNARITNSALGNPPLTTFTQHGTAENPCQLRSFPGESVVIDGSSITRPLPGVSDAQTPELFTISGNYWRVEGWPSDDPNDPTKYWIEFRNSAGSGFRTRLTEGVKLRYVKAHSNEGSGFNLQTSYNGTLEDFAAWNNYSYSNNGETADGVSIGNGSGWTCRYGFVAWNGDDGIDTIISTDCLVEYVVAYKNGYFMDGTPGQGNGNGFKVAHLSNPNSGNVYRNCIAAYNRVAGITLNDGGGTVRQCTSLLNAGYGIVGGDHGTEVVRECITALNNNPATFSRQWLQGDMPPALLTHNSWQVGATVNSNDFVSLSFDENWRTWHQVAASGFTKLAPDSDLKAKGEAGQDLGWEGAVPIDPPASLTLTPGDGEIFAEWSAVLGATKYRYRINGGAWAETTGLSHTFTGLANGVNYTIDVQAGDGTSWSASKSGSATPFDGGGVIEIPAIGESAYGGYMAGIIDATKGNIIPNDAYQTGRRYMLIVSPKSLEAVVNSSRQWHSSGVDFAAAKTRWDGLAATEAMIVAGSDFEAAAYVSGLSYDTEDGGSPWYIPAMDELELLYRNLKPTTEATATASETNTFPGTAQAFGFNPSSDPQGAAYSEGAPTQTSVIDFQSGQAEELGSVIVSSTWADATSYWCQDMRDGWQFEYGQTNTSSGVFIRPVRRVYLNEVAPSEVTLTLANGLHDGYGDNGSFNNSITQLAGFGDSSRLFLYWTLPEGLTPGSEILEARLSLVPRNPETDAGSALVQAHDVDNAAVPTSWADIAAWDDQLTTASVQWDVPAFNSGNYGTRLWSPDIKDVVQEIVDRVGFEAGNAILFILMPNAPQLGGEKYAYSYEYASNVRPQLYIKWIPA